MKFYKESLWGAYEVPVLLAPVTQVAHSYLMLYRKVEGAIKYHSHGKGYPYYLHRARANELNPPYEYPLTNATD